MTSETFDIIVIGAGPAGLAAAVLASRYGAAILVLDEQSAVGGQIYRAVDAMKHRNRTELGKSYHDGLKLTEEFHHCCSDGSIRYIPNATVWLLSKDQEVGYSSGGVAHIVSAKEIIVATGAQERPFPILGWTLPGVMTIGAAQILLKESEIGIDNAIFAGSGPLFYLVIHQYIEAGIPIKAVVDITPKSNYLNALRHLPRALPSVQKILEGWQWKRNIKSSGITHFEGATGLRVLGTDHAQGIEYEQGSTWKSLASEHILMHLGVVPSVNLALSAGCGCSWSAAQSCWTIDVDQWFQSTSPGIRVAGDGTSIGGAIAAELRGRLAALGALHKLALLSSRKCTELAMPYNKALKSEMRIRPFLDALFRPADYFRIPADEATIICRCEEVTLGQIRRFVEDGCAGPNQLKSYSRCGMGPCQGRFCGLTVSELIAEMLNKPVNDVGYYRLRSPVKPLPLAQLAGLDGTIEEG